MTDGTAQTTQASGQSSSQSASQGSSVTAGTAQAAGSQQTSTSQDTTGQKTADQTNSGQTQQAAGQQQTSIPQRPAYVPEQFYDATTGKVNEEKFAEHVNAQTARIAAEESKRLTLPQTPEAYQAALPADFKAPEGIKFEFEQNDPLLAQAKAIAHELGIPQEGFSRLLGLYAGARVGEAAQVATARTAEVAKLGPTGPARVDAIGTFFKATLGESEGAQLLSRLFTASDVQIAEKLVAKFASQGAGGFSQQHRDVTAAGKVTAEQYEKMSYSEKKDYAAKHSQAA